MTMGVSTTPNGAPVKKNGKSKKMMVPNDKRTPR